ncbi:alpha/beta hydrolase [Fimbriimonas ginsengisoli]|uniref:Peptidase S9 prolyl oligopeptidase catalytic domain-containing protein n=1 Tax=Fimbriimonas ginsengisoli Gsoil 348 TaxID=661478 RepID=A0A068NUY6_FIMGI|nr:alpha/beta hydrolase [Fimbriimonas ginsengisoli]AIE87172.1 hypothetical protein OP10G_3804 [Fimbriimonas ginsengisoli Gsoil 348]
MSAFTSVLLMVVIATGIGQGTTKPKGVPLRELTTAIDRLVARIDAIEPTAQPNLFRRHLRSVRALLLTEEGRAAIYCGGANDVSAQTTEIVSQLQRGFDADAGDWNSYLEGRRSLLMAYVSKRDNTVAHYWLTLPKSWQPEQAYPLYFELHGAGDPHPLGWAQGQLGLPEGVKAEEYKRPTMVPMVERLGFHVYPFGRGNSGYTDIGETDVWEALADAEATVKLDPARYYLYGFSMGGGGTWRIATRTPDKWAAAAMLAPAARSMKQDAAVGLGRNVANLPLWIWVGADDGLAPTARLLRDEIAKYGPMPPYREEPATGHNYLQEAQRAAMRFFDGKVRKRPSHFAFVADTAEHNGVWGVTMVRDLAVSGSPSFECTVDGSSVKIDSQGTPKLTVDLLAMGLTGEVTVTWNGRKAYRGPAKLVTIDP